MSDPATLYLIKPSDVPPCFLRAWTNCILHIAVYPISLCPITLYQVLPLRRDASRCVLKVLGHVTHRALSVIVRRPIVGHAAPLLLQSCR